MAPSDRWGIALGLQGEGHPSTFKQIEREVRYLRYRGPRIARSRFLWLLRQPALQAVRQSLLQVLHCPCSEAG